MKFCLLLFCCLTGIFAQAQDYRIENGEVVISKQVKFKTGTADLLPESDAALAIIKQYLEDKSYVSLLRIEANVNMNAGTDQSLSAQRAKAVYSKLVSLGVDCKRLIAVAFGNNKPSVDNSTAEGRAANTNIKFVNAALRGHLIGGMPADGGGETVKADCN